MSAAAKVLREVRASGAELALVDGKLRLRGALPDALRAALREHKAEVAAIVAGRACCWCGSPLAWPGPVGVTFLDGRTECMRCADAEVDRIWRAAERVTSSPDAMADEAELMLRPGGLSE